MNKEVREQRIAISRGKCEWCGQLRPLQFHHLVDKDARRRTDSEKYGVECGRMLCENCHLGGQKYLAIPHFRKEFELYLRSIGKTDDEIRDITGRKLHV